MGKGLNPVKTIVGGVLGGLLGSPKDVPAQPAPTPMPEAPNSDDVQVREAKRKKAAQIQSRSGRLSTILSDTGGSDKLGG